MSKIVDTIKHLENVAVVGPATKGQVTDAELQLRISFSDEYKAYLIEFGAIATNGLELTGIIDDECYNVVSATKQAWELNPNVPHNMYVLEDTFMDGIIIWQNTMGEVFQTRPNSAPMKIADSLQDFIMNRTSK